MQKGQHHWILEETIYLILLAVPVAIECFSEGVQIKLSNVFIGRASGNNIALMLSALFIGQTVIGVITYPIAEGFGIYVNVLCSQAYGAKQYKLVGLYFYRALFMAALTCFPVFTVFISVRPIVYLLFQDRELAQYTGSFTDVLCFGYPAYLYYKIGFRLLQALNIVWGPVLYIIIGNILNGVIQYILIFRYNTTLAGAAAGYVISNYLVALLVFTHIQLSHVHTLIAHKWTIEYITNWLHTARYAIVPIGQMMIAMFPTTITPIICIGLMSHDKRELAIYSILFSIWWVCNIGVMGFASALTVRVGNLLGANEPIRAKRTTVIGLAYGQLTILMCTIITFVTSDPLSHLFTTDPTFARELAWNIRLFSFILNSDIFTIVQGVMNACCKQGILLILGIIFQIFVATGATVLLEHFVQWKALCVFLLYAISSILCFIIASLILLCSRWESIALFVRTNTTVEEVSDTTLEEDGPHIYNFLDINKTRGLQLLRYSGCLILPLCIFVTVNAIIELTMY